MLRTRWVLAGLAFLPIAELAVFLAIASVIGVLSALGLMLATSFAGMALIRGAGGMARTQFRAATGADTLELRAPGVFTVFAGILLLAPGFLTDLAGILLLIPALRRRILARLLRGLGEARRNEDTVVELDPDQWRRVPDEPAETDPRPGRHSCPPAPAVLATPPENLGSVSRVREDQ
jgi:UPF0716 protein FxsA